MSEVQAPRWVVVAHRRTKVSSLRRSGIRYFDAELADCAVADVAAGEAPPAARAVLADVFLVIWADPTGLLQLFELRPRTRAASQCAALDSRLGVPGHLEECLIGMNDRAGQIEENHSERLGLKHALQSLLAFLQRFLSAATFEEVGGLARENVEQAQFLLTGCVGFAPVGGNHTNEPAISRRDRSGLHGEDAAQLVMLHGISGRLRYARTHIGNDDPIAFTESRAATRAGREGIASQNLAESG